MYKRPVSAWTRSVRNRRATLSPPARSAFHQWCKTSSIGLTARPVDPEMNEAASALLREMEALPMRQRMVFYLAEVEGHSLKDVAGILGLKAGTVRHHFFKARERLKERPSYAEAILGYPHPLIDHGIRRLREAKAADPTLRDALEGTSARANISGRTTP